MPTYSGTKDSIGIEFFTDPYTSANLFTARAYHPGDWKAAHDMPTGFDQSIDKVYANPYSTSFDGSLTDDFFGDWYYRIHFIPARVDLGNLVSSQSRNVLLWNAYLTDKSLDSFTSSGMDGITLTPPTGYDPPATIQALALLTYNLEIDIAGPPTIGATLTWEIEGVEYTVPVEGRRVVAFAFPPNWNRGVNETLEMKSSVVRNHDGSEQRASLRQKARRSFEYTTLLTHVEAQRADSLMFGWQSRLFAMPVWPEESRLIDPIEPGATELTLDTAHRSFAVGGLLMIFGSSALVEVREIEGIDGNTVTLTSGTAFAWSANTRIYPALVSALNNEVSGARHTDRTLELSLSFTAEPSATIANVAGTAEATYQGVELSLAKFNWSENMEANWSSDYELLDLGTGKFGLLGRSGVSDISRSHNWLLKSRQETAEFRGFFSRRGGRAVPVYIPSGFEDFTLDAPVLASDTALDCRQNDYETQVGNHPARRDIVILFRDGTHIARRVLNTELTPEGRTRLVVDTAFGRNFDASEIKRISYLGLSRMASDAVTVSHMTKGVATVKATLVNTAT